MERRDADPARWRRARVRSPTLTGEVPAVVARNIAYRAGGHRFQTLDLYLPETDETLALVDRPAVSLPTPPKANDEPRIHVHVHGGAWRDPHVAATSIEPTVAHAFVAEPRSVAAVASINYSLSPFPTHPTAPYDPSRGGYRDDARSARHPGHVADVIAALHFLRSFGVEDRSYILSGHSCGAALVFQAILAGPSHFGLAEAPDGPCPAAIIGLNGLYDLPALVDHLDAGHAHLRDEYDRLLSLAFGERGAWRAASPSELDASLVAGRVRRGCAPSLVVLDQSPDDQLVPMNQRDRLAARLREVAGVRTVIGHRCSGKHAEPWERGDALWSSVRDVIDLLRRTPS